MLNNEFKYFLCLVMNLNIIMLSILVYLSIYDFMFSNEFKYFYA